MSKPDFELIKKLALESGVSGNERRVRELIEKEIAPFCDNVYTDCLGNLIATKGGGGERLLLCAAMDEPGFIITNVKEGGGAFLSFEAVGGIKPHSVVSEAVVVGDKKIPGIISVKAVHLTTKEEREKPALLKDLFIDIGADEKSDTEDIMPGDYACFGSGFAELGENSLCCKAVGSRACCGILAALLKEDLKNSITCVFTVQRQTGQRGAKLSFGIDERELREAVVLDTADDERIKPGEGVAAPRLVGDTCVDERTADAVERAAGGKIQPLANKSTAGDVSSLSVRGFGIRCAELDIPVRNKNTSAETADRRDIEAAYSTLLKYVNTDFEK